MARGAAGLRENRMRRLPANRRKLRRKAKTRAVVHDMYRAAHNLKVTGSNTVPATNDPIVPTEPPFALREAAVLAFVGCWSGAPGPTSARC